MKHNLPLSLCTVLGWCNVSSAQGITRCDTGLMESLNPEDEPYSTLESPQFLSQSVFANPYIIEDGQSFFLSNKKEDKELQRLKSKYFSLSLPLAHIWVTSKFGMRFHPVLKEYRNHLGVDLRARYQPTYAMMTGRVENTGDNGAAGKFVICSHGKYTVYYYHLSEIKVTQGQIVKAGDIIGITGNTGRGTGPHLHLGVQFAGQYIDPMKLLVKIQRTKIGLLKEIMEQAKSVNKT